MENEVKRREWVKTAAIIFLAVLLVLTFFSNTILNASLIAVSAQQVSGGSIRARITGNGTVSANETYDVTIKQTRKVASIKARVGREVTEGEVLFVLEAEESEELKAAQETLNSLQLDYDKSMIALGNTNATNNREVQKLQKAYDEAVADFKAYGTIDADKVDQMKTEEEARLKELQRNQSAAEADYSRAQSSEQYQTAKADYEAAKAKVSELEAKIEGLMGKISGPQEDPAAQIEEVRSKIAELKGKTIPELEENVRKAEERLENAKTDTSYQLLLVNICENDENVASVIASDLDTLKVRVMLAGLAVGDAVNTVAKDIQTAYSTINEAKTALNTAQTELEKAREELKGLTELESQLSELIEKQTQYESETVYRNQLEEARKQYSEAMSARDRYAGSVDRYELEIEAARRRVDNAKMLVEDQQDKISNLTSAASAADTVKAAKQALEDKIFEVSLGTTDGLDLNEKKRKIEQAQKDVDDLIANSDEMEIKAPVSGVVESINISAGREAAKDDTLMTICLQDRGYTVQLPVTAEQAKRVKVGDTADTDLFFTNITATLESIQPDPNNKNSGKLLVFRLDGDVTPGQNLRLSIGQKSQNYDCLVPKSAVASDANGKYVLAIKVKQTPLKDRYIAQRVEVQVIAEDDTNSAVSGLEAGTFVIVTSSSPSLKAGDEVRLSESAG